MVLHELNLYARWVFFLQHQFFGLGEIESKRSSRPYLDVRMRMITNASVERLANSRSVNHFTVVFCFTSISLLSFGRWRGRSTTAFGILSLYFCKGRFMD